MTEESRPDQPWVSARALAADSNSNAGGPAVLLRSVLDPAGDLLERGRKEKVSKNLRRRREVGGQGRCLAFFLIRCVGRV